MESGSRPSWDGCGAITGGFTGVKGFELSASEVYAFFSRFGRRPNLDATNAVNCHTVNKCFFAMTLHIKPDI